MLREFTLQPNEDKRIQVEGQFLVITQATGAVELTIGGTTPITVDEKDRIHLRGDSPNDRAIRIKNVSGAVNTIELHTSDLLVDKRTGVNVTNSLSIAEDQIIGIDPNANIVQSIVQNDIRIDPQQNTVSIDNGQVIGIDPANNNVSATIENAINVDSVNGVVNTEINSPIEVAGEQIIGIDPNNNNVNATIENAINVDSVNGVVNTEINSPVEIADGQIVGISPVFNIVRTPNLPKVKRLRRFSPLVFQGESFIVGNRRRHKILLTADIDNDGLIWIGASAENPASGIPLRAGEHMEIEGTGSVGLDAVGNSDQILYFAETYFAE